MCASGNNVGVSSHTMCLLGLKLRSSGLAPSTFTYWILGSLLPTVGKQPQVRRSGGTESGCPGQIAPAPSQKEQLSPGLTLPLHLQKQNIPRY